VGAEGPRLAAIGAGDDVGRGLAGVPNLAEEKRPDAMICTGRSDFPNQVNNVLCFPYIFSSISGLSTPPAERPRKTSAPGITSASVRACVSWGAGLPQPARLARRAPREHLRHRH
jgi:hypothetical protein